MTDADLPPSDDSIANDLDLTPRTNVDGTAVASRRKRNWLPILVLALVVVAGGVIVTQFLTSAVDYYCNVDEINVRDGCDDDRRIRLQGTVDEGSVVRSDRRHRLYDLVQRSFVARPVRGRARRHLQRVHPGRGARRHRTRCIDRAIALK